MGKIADALDRHKREKNIKKAMLPVEAVDNWANKGPTTDTAANLIVDKDINPKLVTLLAPESMEAEYFKMLRAHVLFQKDDQRPRTIMIASAFPGEGKTFVASNLAISMALGIDEYVLLVDCDFRKPSLHEMLGYSNREGLVDYLAGTKKLSELLIRTRIEKLSLLPAGNPSAKPSEWLSSYLMKDFLEEVKERYQDRYIIIDTTPIQITVEPKVLATYVDGIIIVVLAHQSPREAVKRSIESLGRKKILGIVFNGYFTSHRSYSNYLKDYYK